MGAVVVIPVFDEAPTVGLVVNEARRHAPVIVVDDGSRDDSAAIARAAGADVVRHPRRAGKGAALRTGFEAARAQGAARVVTVDGDGQHDPRDIPCLLAAAQRWPEAIVIGSRLGAIDGMPRARAHATRVGAFFLSWATGLPAVDTQSGFRVYPLGLVDTLAPRAGGFVWETEILARAAARGVAVVEVPVAVIARVARRSRFRPLVDGAAIAAYLSGPVASRWRGEVVAAAHEVAGIFDRDRLEGRHTEMWAATLAAPPLLWGPTLARVATRRACARLLVWWRHPRRRQAMVAAWASLAAPGVLGLLAVQSACGERAPDLAGPLVRRLYDPSGLAARSALDGEAAASALSPALPVSR